ncbi:Peptidoglycan-binding Lysin subgroup [Macrophomina phaseolina MS6]|uniref:Peptidoglycan-binding Lysin subgroup n=1 Tax=Macrophomina phaseolina (strain MS6) TaxID=1126212 RepID=K2QHW4_MACPH|nr:Peptidoglycan-binding Lysin subgroup [Macrophomina phaseolina MS6]
MASLTNHLLAILLALPAFAFSATAAATCNTTALNTTFGLYPITEYGTTIFDVANATGRGVCDIARANIMADVEIVPNVGQEIYIPAQVCEPDNATCLLPRINSTRTCIYGGPRLYYTVNGDTYEIIARRLNITAESLMVYAKDGETSTTILEPGQFLKVPLCDPSQCIVQPFSFEYGVYKDLAEKYGTTVGQIMMLSPTYNYSSIARLGGTPPPINLPINCTALSSNITVLD